MYTLLIRDNVCKVMKDGKYFCMIAIYTNTPVFKVQELAQKIVNLMNSHPNEVQ